MKGAGGYGSGLLFRQVVPPVDVRNGGEEDASQADLRALAVMRARITDMPEAVDGQNPHHQAPKRNMSALVFEHVLASQRARQGA